MLPINHLGRLRSMISAAPLASSSSPTARPSSRGRSAGPPRRRGASLRGGTGGRAPAGVAPAGVVDAPASRSPPAPAPRALGGRGLLAAPPAPPPIEVPH